MSFSQDDLHRALPSPQLLVVSAWWPEIRAMASLMSGSLAPLATTDGSSLKTPRISDAERQWLAMRGVSLPVSLPVSVLGSAPEASPPCAEPDILYARDGTLAFAVLGLGSVRAASRLAHLLARHPDCKKVVFCGTAGAYDPVIACTTVALCKHVVWSDAGLVQGLCYLPGVPEHPARSKNLENIEKIEHSKTTDSKTTDSKMANLQSRLFEGQKIDITSEFSPDFGIHVQAQRCLSQAGVTKDPNLAAAYRQVAELENLELFGVAQASILARVEWCGLLGVSNTVGPDAHVQWAKSHIEASLAVQTCFYAAISGGGSSGLASL